MFRWILCALVFLMACTVTNADAATISNQSSALTPILPARGAYFDSSKSGTGVAVDVGLNGFIFLTYYGYDTLGAPTWYSIQGQWTPNSEAQRLATGVIGTLNSPLLYASGGQCITCDFTTGPTLSIAPYSVAVSWTSPRHLDLTIGNEHWHMAAIQYGTSDDQLLAGTWQLTISWDGGAQANAGNGGVAARTQIVKVEPGFPFPAVEGVIVMPDPNIDPSIALPPPGSNYYPVDQSTTCPTGGPTPRIFYGAAFSDIFHATQMSALFSDYPSGEWSAPMLWYNAAQGRGGLDVVTQAMGVDTVPLALGPNNIHFDLYVEPDRVVGHGFVQGQNLIGVPAGFWQPDTVALNLVMERLPDGLVERSIYPCAIFF
jgi:hypothetical protein